MGDSDQSTAYTVSQAMNAAKLGLEKIRLTVIGEVSEFNDKPGYKAAYFSVHDDECTMPCLMWRDRYNASGVALQAGMLVELTGNFSCYPAKGRMQFSVASMQLAGEGKLRMQVAQLARKLKAEGLMDQARKRRIPALPQRIAVVTSPRGKAVHDVIRTLRRRYPMGQLYVCGVPVEGANAAQHIIQGLQAAAAAVPAPDVILLVRGGGSYEDLMPFNDEALARAVAASPIPVVTGIGHEPDNSICDMVSDRRCSTPTAAAEAIALSQDELRTKLGNARVALQQALRNYLRIQRSTLVNLSDRPLWHDPHYFTGAYLQTLDSLGERLVRAIPDALSADARTLRIYKERLLGLGGTLCDRYRSKLALSAATLDALSPLKTLSRGYSIAYAQDGRTVISSVEAAASGEDIFVQVQDGRLACTVKQIERGNNG